MKSKLVNLSLLVSLYNINSLQISVKVKWSNSKKKNLWTRIEILVEKKPPLHKKFWSIYLEVFSVSWSNFKVVKYNSKTPNIYHHIKFRKSIMNRCSIKKPLLKVLQCSQKNTCVRVSFLIIMQAFSPATLLKRDSKTGAFLWILRNFSEHLFWRTSVNGC